MKKQNLGIVRAVKGEDRGGKNAPLTTHALPTPVRKPDTARPAKMITTHDEPKKDAADILYESDMDYAVKAAQRVDEDFKADTKETPLAKKPGRPKKEK